VIIGLSLSNSMFSLVNLHLAISTSVIATVFASSTAHFLELTDYTGLVTFRIPAQKSQIATHIICTGCIILYIFAPILVITALLCVVHY
jgi:hypothetical protein